MHAWTICSNVLSFSAHVVACPQTEQERVELRRRIQQVLSGRFGFADTTIELECTPPEDTGLLRPIDHDGQEPRHERHEQ
jgi:Co/Zn/Cd efflux system component